MFGLGKKGKDDVARLAAAKVAGQLEIEKLDRERRELMAKRFEAEDDQADLAAIDKLLTENARSMELARGAAGAAQEALEAAAVKEAGRRVAELPEKRAEHDRLKSEIENRAAMFFELAALYFACAGRGEWVARIRAAIGVPSVLSGGIFEDPAAALVAAGKKAAASYLATNGPLPDLQAEGGELRLLEAQSGTVSTNSPLVERIYKRALQQAERDAGITDADRQRRNMAAWRLRQNQA